MHDIRLVTNPAELSGIILNGCATCERLAVAVAWAHEGNVGATALHEALLRLSTRQRQRSPVVVGLAMGHTSRAFLELFREFPNVRYARRSTYNTGQDRAVFHPKMYVFVKPDGLATALIGSANLTNGGMSLNMEACIRIDGDVTDPVIAACECRIRDWHAATDAYADLDEYEEADHSGAPYDGDDDDAHTKRQAKLLQSMVKDDEVTTSKPKPGTKSRPRITTRARTMYQDIDVAGIKQLTQEYNAYLATKQEDDIVLSRVKPTIFTEFYDDASGIRIEATDKICPNLGRMISKKWGWFTGDTNHYVPGEELVCVDLITRKNRSIRAMVYRMYVSGVVRNGHEGNLPLVFQAGQSSVIDALSRRVTAHIAQHKLGLKQAEKRITRDLLVQLMRPEA